jgi:hypothetical protein
MKKMISALICLLFATGISIAQEELKPRVSPLEMVTMKYEDTYIKITYSRPHKRDRQIFGELVPYDKVWRTGANEATEITVTGGKIRIGGKELEPGAYTLFTIPQKNKWTIILNKDVGQWGAYNYNPDMDVMRFDVPVKSTDVAYEPFTIEFEQHHDSTNILIMWDRTRIEIPFQFVGA